MFTFKGNQGAPTASGVEEVGALVKAGAFEKARARFVELGEVVRNTEEGRALKAVIDFRRGDYKAAGWGFRQMAKQRNAPPELYWYLGHVLAQDGRMKAARRAWTRFVNEKPEHAQANGLRQLLQGTPGK